MAFFDDIRQRVNKAAQSAKENAEVSRIANEIRNIDIEVESLIAQIGHAYYASKGEDVEGLSALCERVEELKARQVELEQQKVLARNQNICPGCGAVMPKEFKFCSNCGAKMPEPPAEEEPAEEEPVAEAEPEVEEEPAVEAEPEVEDEAEPEAEDEEDEPEEDEEDEPEEPDPEETKGE